LKNTNINIINNLHENKDASSKNTIHNEKNFKKIDLKNLKDKSNTKLNVSHNYNLFNFEEFYLFFFLLISKTIFLITFFKLYSSSIIFFFISLFEFK